MHFAHSKGEIDNRTLANHKVDAATRLRAEALFLGNHFITAYRNRWRRIMALAIALHLALSARFKIPYCADNGRSDNLGMHWRNQNAGKRGCQSVEEENNDACTPAFHKTTPYNS